MDREQRRGLQAAITAYVMWGLLTLYWKELHGFDPIELVGWRIATAGVVMTAYLLLSGRAGNLRPLLGDRRTLLMVVAASLLLTVNWSTYVWAVSNDHVIETALGYFLAPLGTMAIGVLVLGERLTPLKRASIVCAVAAVAVLIVSYGAIPWVAVLLAFSWTSYGFVKRRVELDPVTSLTAELLVLIVPAFAIVAFSFGSSDGIPHTASGREFALVLGTGIITATPLLLFAFAAKRVPFTILGPANYLIPVTNFLLGWLVFDEGLPPSRVVGFALVWCALIFATVDMVRGANKVGTRIHTQPEGPQMRRMTAVLASSILLLAACGGGDDSTGGSAQDAAADELIQQANDQNLQPDEGCIRDKAAKLSDEDAQKIVDAGEESPDLSPEGLTIEGEAMSCVSGSAMMDQIVEGLPEGVDGDCVRDKLKDADFGAIASSGSLPPELSDAITECGTG